MVMKSRYQFIIATLLSFSFTVSAKDVGAPNIDFSEGNSDGWTLETGDYYRQQDGSYGYEWNDKETQSSNRFSLLNSVMKDDPIVKCDDFMENPFEDGAITIRIGVPGFNKGTEGDLTAKAAAERATYKFVVTEESKVLIVNFACVIHSQEINNIHSEHSKEQKPYFGMNVEMRGPSGDVSTVDCSSFESSDEKMLVYMKQPSQPCKYSESFSSLSEYSYLPWTSMVYDLTDKVGYEVTITFQTHDCLRFRSDREEEGAGSHEAYGYFYVETSDLKFDLALSKTKGGNPTIKAPKGFANYEWLVDGGESPIFLFKKDDGSEVEIDRSLMTPDSKYSCVMRGAMESCGSVTLQTGLTIDIKYLSVKMKDGSVNRFEKNKISSVYHEPMDEQNQTSLSEERDMCIKDVDGNITKFKVDDIEEVYLEEGVRE